MVIDIPEIIFSTIFTNYKFRPHLLSDSTKEIELGLLFSDGLILPLTAILFCHFASQTQKHWRLAFIFTGIHYILERIYLALDFLEYEKWNIWISMLIYLLGFRFFAHYARRMLLYNPPIPYSIRIASITYCINGWIGGVIGGALIGMYQWRPHIFSKVGADERFCDLGLGWTFGVLSAFIVPHISILKVVAFIGTGISTVSR
jgi:hypothetical protein